MIQGVVVRPIKVVPVVLLRAVATASIREVKADPCLNFLWWAYFLRPICVEW